MSQRIITFAALILALFIPSAAALGQGLSNDARGLPTVAPLIEEIDDTVVNISVVSERPAQLTPLFRNPFFQPFLPPPDELPPQRRMAARSAPRKGFARGLLHHPLGPCPGHHFAPKPSSSSSVGDSARTAMQPGLLSRCQTRLALLCDAPTLIILNPAAPQL